MLVFKYFSNINDGFIKPYMDINDFRKQLKSSYITFENEDNIDFPERDIFNSIGIQSSYNDNLKTYNLDINDENKFMYKDINLIDDVKNILLKFKENKIEYKIDEYGMTIENGIIGLFIPDMIEDQSDSEFNEQKVRSINIYFDHGECSLSFERLISNHIPSKKTYEKSKISSDDAPSVLMYLEHQKYLASHGKSKDTAQYIEMQKKLVAEGKVIEAIQKDIEDIKNKTNIIYTKGLNQMKNYAKTLNPNDFIEK
ncbi:hypothetical protein [Silvanigrella sp.]|jgi:hypothetical protein|uniref:hypothetical protein n=1 Tax=Silvanigrella sp. TaxID=2024976 RepID=UPI0037CAD039